MSIDFSQAVYVPYTRRDDVPHQPGVYVVKQGDAVLYVGQTKSLYRRLRLDRHFTIRLILKTIPAEELGLYCFLMPKKEAWLKEPEFISALAPVFNKQPPPKNRKPEQRPTSIGWFKDDVE